MTRRTPFYAGDCASAGAIHASTAYTFSGWNSGVFYGYDVAIIISLQSGSFTAASATGGPWVAIIGGSPSLASTNIWWTWGKGPGIPSVPTISGTNTGAHQAGFVIRGAKLTTPIGHKASNSGNSNSATCPAITATTDHSLAICMYDANAVSPSSWPPSGWTNLYNNAGNIYVAYKELTNQGDSSGSLTVGLVGSNAWSLSQFEVMAADVVPGDFYANGWPQRMNQNTVYVAPGKGGGSGQGKGKGGGGSKGNKPPATSATYDPYGRFSTYYEVQEAIREISRRKKRGAAVFPTNVIYTQLISVAAHTATLLGPKTVGKTVRASSHGAVSSLKTVSHTVRLTGTSATKVLKRVNKTMLIHSVTATTVRAIKVILLRIAVACISSVSVTKKVGKTVALSSHGAVIVLKRVGHGILIHSTSATSITKRVGKTVQMTAHSATTMTKRVGKTIKATCISAVRKALRVGKIIAVSCTSAVSVKAARFYKIMISATAHTAVTMHRSIGKTVAMSAHTATLVQKSVAKFVRTASSSSVAVVKRAGKGIAAHVTSAAAVSRIIGKGVTASLASATSMTRQVGKTVLVRSSGAVTMTKGVATTVQVQATATVQVIKALAKTIRVSIASGSGITSVTVGASKVPPLILRGIFRIYESVVGSFTTAIGIAGTFDPKNITLSGSMEKDVTLRGEFDDPNIVIRGEDAPEDNP